MEIERVVVEHDGAVRFEDLEVRVRFREVTYKGHFVPVGVELIDDRVLSLRTLREIPFGRLEAVANKLVVANLIRERMFESGPHPPVIVDLREPVEAERQITAILADQPTRYGDEFYQLIGQLYEWADTQSERPAALVAARLDVPDGRVWRWVTSRRRIARW